MGSVSSADGVNQLPELRPVSAGGMEYATIEKDMVLCGVVGIQDPARPEVKDSINSCKEAGIRVMMITGDGKDTAVAIARDTGIFGEYEDTNIDSSVFTGKEFFAQSSEKQLEVLKHGKKVFCRTEPKDKQQLISLLDSLG